MGFLSTFFEGLFIGFGAAIPLGPINLLIMNEALKSYKNALFIGVGAMSADVSYLALILFGASHLLEGTPLFEMLLIFGGSFLLFIAYKIFASRNNTIEKTQYIKERRVIFYLIKGYLLTLLNPYTMLFWLSMSSYSLATNSLFATLFGMLCAIGLWIVLMPLFIYSRRTLISTKLSFILAILSSLLIAFFGISMLLKSKMTNFLY